jgi:hypothetical protein
VPQRKRTGAGSPHNKLACVRKVHLQTTVHDLLCPSQTEVLPLKTGGFTTQNLLHCLSLTIRSTCFGHNNARNTLSESYGSINHCAVSSWFYSLHIIDDARTNTQPTSLCYGDDMTLGTEPQLQPDGIAYTDGTLQGA